LGNQPGIFYGWRVFFEISNNDYQRRCFMKTAIDKLLSDMTKLRGRVAGSGKGEIGEAAAFQILTLYKNRIGRRCVIIQSYAYPYASNIEGNIKLTTEGGFIHEPGKAGTDDEIDIVMITDHRIFLIEVKAYSGQIKVNDIWTHHANQWDEKSPICQAEKHGRHFYHSFFDVLPDGRHEYIKLVTVFTGLCVVEDMRTKNKEYIPIAIANDVNKIISMYDVPGEYSIDVDAVINRMLEKKSAVKSVLM